MWVAEAERRLGIYPILGKMQVGEQAIRLNDDGGGEEVRVR